MHSSRASTPGDAAGARSRAPAILWIPDDDLRLVVRGVLSLEGHPVVLELKGIDPLIRLDPPSAPTLLILDAGGVAGSWTDQLAELLRIRPELRVVVLLPPNSAETAPAEARRLGARGCVVRPIVLNELVQAVDDALRPSGPDGPRDL